MHISSIALAALAAFTPLASAVGSAVVKNNCDFTTYVYSVGSSPGAEHALDPGEAYSEGFHRDPVTGGIALKIFRVPNGISGPNPQTVFAYNLDDSQIWYDLSDVFGDPFEGHSLTLSPSDEACGVISWEDGKPPAGSQVKVCQSGSDLTLKLCG
ncbi:hypothetical protein AJ80_04833 [Polytolypa hystricis UAMH7299]|uniref:Bys1 family protein n=1 Tax=Polytolypa hystricis (strain UAMH7299) TaxID=1447883 RepID=A0A2B7Y8Y6_POLH7|nr:hypothetical protein AJ80_04833 [Polytolypa hystricis UAMH7299]